MVSATYRFDLKPAPGQKMTSVVQDVVHVLLVFHMEVVQLLEQEDEDKVTTQKQDVIISVLPSGSIASDLR